MPGALGSANAYLTAPLTAPLIAAMLAAMTTGCANQHHELSGVEWNDQARRDTNAWLLRTYQGQQIENAVTRQHTIWSHHFVQGTTSLTPRAERDLGILRDHYLRHDGGVLTVRRGEAGDELFEARLATLEDWLEGEGVRLASVTVEHDLYTGDGKRSTRAAQDYVRPSSEEPYDFHHSGDK